VTPGVGADLERVAAGAAAQRADRTHVPGAPRTCRRRAARVVHRQRTFPTSRRILHQHRQPTSGFRQIICTTFGAEINVWNSKRLVLQTSVPTEQNYRPPFSDLRFFRWPRLAESVI